MRFLLWHNELCQRKSENVSILQQLKYVRENANVEHFWHSNSCYGNSYQFNIKILFSLQI